MARRSRKLYYRFADSEPLELRVLLSSDGIDFEEFDDDRDDDSDDERFENDFDDDEEDDSDDDRFEGDNHDEADDASSGEEREDDFESDASFDDDSLSLGQIATFLDIDTAFTSLATETNDFGSGGESNLSESSGSGFEIEAPVESEQQHDLSDQPVASTVASEPGATEVDGTEAVAEPESLAVTENASANASSDDETELAAARAHEDGGPWPGASDFPIGAANDIASPSGPGDVAIAAGSEKPASSDAVDEISAEGVVPVARSIELAALPLLSAVIPNMNSGYSSTAVLGVSSLPLLVGQTSFAAAPVALEFAPVTASAGTTTKLSMPIAMTIFITWLGIKEHRRLRGRTVLSVR